MSSPETAVKRPPENIMGTLPIPKVLMSVSLPMMISMLVLSMYNVVDSIFVGMLSENALAAVSLAFPVQMLIVSVSVGTGIGVNAVLSRSLGEKNFIRADRIAMNSITLVFFSALVFILIGIFGVKPFFAGQTVGADPEIYRYGVQYLTVICVCSVTAFTQTMLERLLQSTGKSVYTMITQAGGAVINIILDPFFIFGIGFFPRLEVLGAAVATVIGQFCAALLALYFNLHFNKEIHFSFGGLKPNLPMIGKIYKVGFPSIVMQSVGSVMGYGMNVILMGFSSTAVAVFGAYFRLQSVIFMPIFGLNGGMIPIVAYNYGAGQRRRIISTVKLSCLISECIMAVGMVLFLFFPEMLLKLFSASEAMIEMGVPALRIISLGFLVAGVCIILSGMFQALGNGVYSLIVSVLRQLVALLPAAFLLAKFSGLSAVWWCFPISEMVSLLAMIVCFFKIKRDILDRIPNGTQEK